MNSLIAPQSLKDLVDANAIRYATVVADKDVYKVTVKCGMVERTVSVRTREGQIKERLFTSLDAVARFMGEKCIWRSTRSTPRISTRAPRQPSARIPPSG